jgi:tripartite-type tricarboxylate transporter receptor subunit TctC
MGKRLAIYLGSIGLALAWALPAKADPVADFYHTHPFTLLVGFSPGGGFDSYGRTVANHLARHIPGHPTVIVQNMPGAGSLRAANHTYNVAPRDGSLVVLSRAPVMDLLMGGPSSAFDSQKFTWIINGGTELTVCAMLGAPQIASFEDARRIPFNMAGTGPGSDEDMFTKVLIELFDVKAKLVTGYPGGNEMTLALERGEVDARCAWAYSSIQQARPDWISQKKVRFLAVLTPERSPTLPEVPSILEFAQTDRERDIMALLVSCQLLGRPFAAPPGIPADRAEALRKAFTDTMADPAFVADMTLRKETVNPIAWQDVEKILKQLYATPKPLVEEARAMIAEK